MQFEVVLRLEGLLADLTLEPPADTVSRKVASEVSFTWENLMVAEEEEHVHAERFTKINKVKHQVCHNVPSDSVGRESCAMQLIDVVLVPPGWNIGFDISRI